MTFDCHQRFHAAITVTHLEAAEKKGLKLNRVSTAAIRRGLLGAVGALLLGELEEAAASLAPRGQEGKSEAE